MGGARKLAGRAAQTRILGLELPLLLLWLALGTTLALIAERVTDWNDMTDELVWERLAVSIWQYGTLIPHLHGQVVKNLAQLYPALISPIFASGDVPADLRNAHILDAWVMSSAAIPAFLLARRVTGRRWPAYLLAVVAVCTPWAVYSTILVTEVVAYPVFLWAIYAMQRAITSPTWRADVLALVTIALAFFTRTQFALLVGVLPVAVLAYELGAPREGSLLEKARAAVLDAVRRHIVLACVYVPLVLALGAYRLAGGSLRSLSLYGKQTAPTILSSATGGSTLGSAADLAFTVGILPFVVGTAWLLAGVFRPSTNRAWHAFACIAATCSAVVLVIVAAWDLTISNAVVDRYLFYLAPLVVLAFVCALLDARRPRWSLVFPVVLVSAGFAWYLQADTVWSGRFPLSMDSPGAWLYKPIADAIGSEHRTALFLAGATVTLTALFLVLARAVPHNRLTVVFAVLLLVAFPVYTAYTFEQLFSTLGHSGRPLTRPEAGVLDWLDLLVGTKAQVTEVPYSVSTNPFVTQEAWRDIEFWNKSIRYAVHYPTPYLFADAIAWFPNTPLTFNPRTGSASASYTPYVLQSINDSRFRISGNEQYAGDGVMLIDATRPWRTDWLTFGLFDDGWTIPHRTAVVRVFSYPGQRQAVIRGLAVQLQEPPKSPPRPFTIQSNAETIHGKVAGAATSFEDVHVCVPPHGYSEVRISTPVTSHIPGDASSIATSTESRLGGVLVSDLGLSDDIGARCVLGP